MVDHKYFLFLGFFGFSFFDEIHFAIQGSLFESKVIIKGSSQVIINLELSITVLKNDHAKGHVRVILHDTRQRK